MTRNYGPKKPTKARQAASAASIANATTAGRETIAEIEARFAANIEALARGKR